MLPNGSLLALVVFYLAYTVWGGIHLLLDELRANTHSPTGIALGTLHFGLLEG
jgi:hypothetical protein